MADIAAMAIGVGAGEAGVTRLDLVLLPALPWELYFSKVKWPRMD